MKLKLSLFLIGIFIIGFAQVPEYNKAYLQKQNKNLKSEIKKLNQQLQKNNSDVKSSIVNVQLIQKKINSQAKLVSNIDVEKKFIEDEIYAFGKQINALNKELAELKKEYEDVLVRAYKNKSSSSKLLFVLSSESLVQAYRRIKYLEKYSDYQLAKVDEIASKQKEINEQRELRKKARQEKNELLASQVVIKEELEQERKHKEVLVKQFEQNRAKIVAELKSKSRQQKKVDADIKKAIEEEIKIAAAKEAAERKKREAEEAERKKQLEIAKQKALEEERKKQAELERIRKEEEKKRLAKLEEERKAKKQAELAEAKKIEDQKERLRQRELARQRADEEKKRIAAEAKAREEEAERKRKAAELAAVRKVENSQPALVDRSSGVTLSSDFESNKGRLPWPVSRGTVVSSFGKHPHAVLKGITVDNSGVDIATSRNAVANSVFDGEVTTVSIIPGGNKTVLVRHGSYFTVYNNLSRVFVKKGDKVKRGQRLGQIYTDGDGETVLKFQVWKQTRKENPASWVGGM